MSNNELPTKMYLAMPVDRFLAGWQTGAIKGNIPPQADLDNFIFGHYLHEDPGHLISEGVGLEKVIQHEPFPQTKWEEWGIPEPPKEEIVSPLEYKNRDPLAGYQTRVILEITGFPDQDKWTRLDHVTWWDLWVDFKGVEDKKDYWKAPQKLMRKKDGQIDYWGDIPIGFIGTIYLDPQQEQEVALFKWGRLMGNYGIPREKIKNLLFEKPSSE